MHNLIALLVLIPLVFLVAHSGALPASRSSALTTNEPRTLLGKPYGRVMGKPSRSSPLWKLAKRNDDSQATAQPAPHRLHPSGAHLLAKPLEAPERPLPLLMNAIPESRKGSMESKIIHVGRNSLQRKPRPLSRRLHGREPGSSRFQSDSTSASVTRPGGPMQHRRSSRSQKRSERTSRLPQEY